MKKKTKKKKILQPHFPTLASKRTDITRIEKCSTVLHNSDPLIYRSWQICKDRIICPSTDNVVSQIFGTWCMKHYNILQ